MAFTPKNDVGSVRSRTQIINGGFDRIGSGVAGCDSHLASQQGGSYAPTGVLGLLAVVLVVMLVTGNI